LVAVYTVPLSISVHFFGLVPITLVTCPPPPPKKKYRYSNHCELKFTMTYFAGFMMFNTSSSAFNSGSAAFISVSSALCPVAHLLKTVPLPSQRRTRPCPNLPYYVQEEAAVLNTRRLWSAHLHSLGPELRSLVADLAAAQHHGGLLGPLLRRVCQQLVSLSPPTASLVVTSVLGACHSCLQTRAAAAVAARLMAFLAWLVAQPAVKAVVNSLFQEEAARHGCP